MDAVLLAGGFGTRMQPLTYTRPKPLLPVAGRAMVEWVLDRLPPEVDRVIVAVNWLAERLEAYFEDSDRDIEFVVVRETEPLGTAGAVKNCQEHIRSARFFVLNADIISDMDMAAMVAQHRDTGAAATISLFQVPLEDVVDFGVAALDEADPRRITAFVEKPPTPEEAPSQFINAGAYLLERTVLDLIEPGRLVSMEKEIFPQVLAAGGLYGAQFTGLWIDVGDPDRLRRASRRLDPTSPFGRGSSIDPSATVLDSIGGEQITIGAGCTLRGCVLGDGVTVPPGTQLYDCVVGDDEVISSSMNGRQVWSRDVPPGYPQKQVGNELSGE